ncbi:arylamine N-acetyltransferase [Mycolicibacterium sp. P9-64]|uniref:arylamine N-acetyltransferase family protein n=1 Tax=Mycolicibacterium sp. P9-64 TaxID=2024612 RepID=UPI0011EE2E47|nr:arylamine N-acetyltransferase [Mycolicibacterium sp. P9-64]KAA0086429.1 arylamine N-acetyltransferase [Mycolicibacterium sp. P9-64]
MTTVASELDLAGYLDRVRYGGSTDPTLETLQGVVAAHNRSIPFETLDPVTGVPVADLGPAALTNKLVHRRRGGYCYEHNGLMGYVLEALGYGIERLAGRVVWMKEPDAPLPAMTHTVLSVTIPDVAGPFLVDVGFGGQTLTSPIRLEAGLVQSTRHEPYRLVASGSDGTELTLQANVRDEWQSLYRFTTRPQPRIDLEVGSWYVSTHPASHFVTGLTVALVTDGERRNLRGRNLAIHHLGGGTEKVRFDTAAQVLDALTERFGIDLDDLGDPSVLEARVATVLDT